ncbi:MAG TPA: hypothetical protein VK999_04515 [Methylotenera sp.]|nr:hypothetical protein [Methylotenera sp.]
MKQVFFASLIILTTWVPVQAMTLPPVPTEPLYYEPPVVKPAEAEQRYDCYQLDRAINELHPYRYTYKPNFYSDGSNKLAASLIVFDSIPLVEGWLGIGYLAYSAMLDEKEARRTENIEQQIRMLQRLKAEQHCFQ